MLAYLTMMAVRLTELHRALKPTGSLYLHCDPTASHYLKLILDAIFAHKHYRNEIIWERTNAHNIKARRFGRVHDTLLFYTKSDDYVWNTLYTAYSPAQLSRYKSEPDGRLYKAENLTMATAKTRNFEWRGSRPPANRGWGASLVQLEQWLAEGRILLKRDGSPRLDGLKVYLDDMPGKPVGSIWTDIDRVGNTSRERIGYPTQKPIALLERVIRASSNEGVVILDPFCGCGTTIDAAENLSRQWTGIDVTHYAVTLIERRLAATHPHARYSVHGRPVDLAGAADLARRDKYQFQWWASWLLGAQVYESKKGADRGIDGNIYFANGPYGYGRIVISVKGGENVSPAMVRELSGVVQREADANMGILVTLMDPTKAMLADAAGAGFVEKSAHGRLPRIQIATVADLLDRRFPKMPPLPQPAANAPRRRGARDRDQLELLLPISAAGPVTKDGAILDPRFLAMDKAV